MMHRHEFWIPYDGETKGAAMITLELVEIVQACPVLRLDTDVNEIGEDCEGCTRHDPDRAELCLRMFRGEQVAQDDPDFWEIEVQRWQD